MEQTKKTLAVPLYPELQDLVLSRDDRRKVFKEMGATLGRETRFVDIGKIVVRDGFNWRIKPEGFTDEEWYAELEIPELALGIYENGGPADPLECDLTVDGKLHLTEGYRRKLAILYLLLEGYENYRNGRPVSQVEVMLNDKDTTDYDREIKVFSSQNKKKLKPMESATRLLRIKNVYSMTHEQIALAIGKSRQWVDNNISLAEEPVVIQKAIADGNLTPTAALGLKRSVKNETDRVHKVQESIDNNIPLTVASADNLRKEKAEAAAGELFDCTNEKETADMDLSEAIGMCDKIRTLIANVQPQYRDDIELWLDRIIKKVDAGREYVKKSSDRR